MGDWSPVEWLGASSPSVSFEGLFSFVKFNVCSCCSNNWASASELASKELVEDLLCFLGLLFHVMILQCHCCCYLSYFDWLSDVFFFSLGLVVGICLARLLTDFARVAIDLLCSLYSLSSLKTLSEVSIFAVLLILLLDCSGWATGRVCELPRLGVIWLLWLFSWLYILLYIYYYIIYYMYYIYIYYIIYYMYYIYIYIYIYIYYIFIKCNMKNNVSY